MANLFGISFDPTPNSIFGSSTIKGAIKSASPGIGALDTAKDAVESSVANPAMRGSSGDAYKLANTEAFRNGGNVYNAGGDVIGHYGTAANTKTANTNQNTSTYPGNTLGASTGTGTGPSAQDLAAYGTYKSQANDELGRLLKSYNATKDSLNSNYDIKTNQLNSAKAHTTDQYNNSITDQNQNLLREQNQVRQGTHNAYQNLMNLLGAYGGGGTSVAQQWAPMAAQHFQNAQLGDANQTTAANLRDLNTTYGNYLEDFKNQQNQLMDSRRQDIANADNQYNDTRSKLNRILDQINGQAVSPGDIGGALSGLDVPSVSFVKPTYTGATPVYNAPNLASFEAATPAASFASPAATSNSAATPALAFLLNQQKRQQPAVA